MGYVGPPLVVEFGKKLRTLGFDIDAKKVASGREQKYPSREIPIEDMRLAKGAEYHSDPVVLREVLGQALRAKQV